MKTSWIFSGALAIFWGAVLGAAFFGVQQQDEEKVLVDNKCQCVKVTSKFVPSKDKPEVEVLERNIRIIVPLQNRENISDPTSPVRTKFVYKIPKLCENCDQSEAYLEDSVGQPSTCNNPEEPCYTYDRNKCYTASCLFSHNGKTKVIETALTPESCYAD
ncbi:immunoglobulin J chain [Hemicordylus capensis]|uniref:immunoglobulin J chain n=1 Tax=Hemicordylus capensis TaxID=884348 RepID=UPI002302CA5B|nr:immunoglobulin J chain [Hemicordylus capensis]